MDWSNAEYNISSQRNDHSDGTIQTITTIAGVFFSRKSSIRKSRVDVDIIVHEDKTEIFRKEFTLTLGSNTSLILISVLRMRDVLLPRVNVNSFRNISH